MGITKYGSGEVLPDPDDQPSTQWTDEDAAKLAAENEAAAAGDDEG